MTSNSEQNASRNQADAIFAKALYCHKNNNSPEAEHLYKEAFTLNPANAYCPYMLGLMAQSANNLETAETYVCRAIEINKDIHLFHSTLGAIYLAQEKTDDALACYERAAELKPTYIAHMNAGTILQGKEDFERALIHFRAAQIFKPDSFEALNNLGTALQSLNRLEDAAICYERAFALKPDSVELLGNLALIKSKFNLLDDAISYYKQVLLLNPHDARNYSSMLFIMLYASSITPEMLFEESVKFGKSIAEPLLRARVMNRNMDADRKLRIGYLSPDFRRHSVNFFFECLLQHHDRKNFEIFGYSNVINEDEVTQRLENKFAHWRIIKNKSDDEAADIIEMDEIDILIDMAGHTASNRLLIFARKPAPIQASWLGYPATTGVKAIDYRLTDHFAEPEGLTEHLNTESLWRLPGLFCCYGGHESNPAIIDHPPCEDNGYITFGCFNNFAKVTNPVLEAWAEIMRQVPDAHLLLEIAGSPDSKFRQEIIERLQRFGLPLERIKIEQRRFENQYVLYNRIDIALDPFPCNGGTTSMDTLWMGVPFITLAGKHFVSRMGVTILTNAGLPELIANNVDEYVAKAVALAIDRDRLKKIRHNLRGKVEASPMMDQRTFARNMEDAYRAMWRKYCAQEKT